MIFQEEELKLKEEYDEFISAGDASIFVERRAAYFMRYANDWDGLIKDFSKHIKEFFTEIESKFWILTKWEFQHNNLNFWYKVPMSFEEFRIKREQEKKTKDIEYQMYLQNKDTFSKLNKAISDYESKNNINKS